MPSFAQVESGCNVQPDQNGNISHLLCMGENGCTRGKAMENRAQGEGNAELGPFSFYHLTLKPTAILLSIHAGADADQFSI